MIVLKGMYSSFEPKPSADYSVFIIAGTIAVVMIIVVVLILTENREPAIAAPPPTTVPPSTASPLAEPATTELPVAVPTPTGPEMQRDPPVATKKPCLQSAFPRWGLVSDLTDGQPIESTCAKVRAAPMKGNVVGKCVDGDIVEQSHTCAEIVYCEADLAKGFPRTEEGGTADTACPAGYENRNKATCQPTGKWLVTESCKRYCPADPGKGFVNTEAPGASVATAACPEGFAGQNRATCEADGQWKMLESCKRKCTNLSGWTVPSGTTFLVEEGTATKSCGTGRTGTITGTCRSDGTVQESSNTCLDVTCPMDAVYGFPVTKSGLSATSNCLGNYTGTVSGLCRSDRTWSVDTSNCTIKKCPRRAEGNYVFPESIADGQPVTGACLPGLFGEVSATCAAGGTWTGVRSTCRTMCTPAMNPGWFGTSTAPIDVNQEITSSQKCIAPTIGTVTGRCMADGSIERRLETERCFYKNCPLTTATGYSLPKADVTATATLYPGTCAVGYKGTVSAVCSESATASSGGVWSQLTNSCKKLITLRDEALRAWNDATTTVSTQQDAYDAYNAETQRYINNCTSSGCYSGVNSTRGPEAGRMYNSLQAAKAAQTAAKTAYDQAVQEYNAHAALYGPQVP